MAVAIIQPGAEKEVPYGGRRIGRERHVAFDAAQPPEVLVFHVAAVVPAVHLHGQQVPARLQVAGHVELRRGLRGFGHAHLLPVDVDAGIAADGTEAQHHLASLPGSGYGEGGPVGTHGVVHVDVGRVGRKHVLDVANDGFAETLQFPVGRHSEVVPGRVVEVGAVEVFHACLDGGGVGKLPRAVERLLPGRSPRFVGHGVFRAVIEAEVGVRLFFVPFVTGGIFPLILLCMS